MTTFADTKQPVHPLREIMIRESQKRPRADPPTLYRLRYFESDECYRNISLHFAIRAHNEVEAVVVAMDYLNNTIIPKKGPPSDEYADAYDLLVECEDKSEMQSWSEEELVDNVLDTWVHGDSLWVEEYTPITTILEPTF